MLSSLRIVCAIIAAALLLPGLAQAYPAADSEYREGAQHKLDVAITVDRLLRLGREDQDPAAMIEAARLAVRHEIVLVTGAQVPPRPREVAKAWLEEARQMAVKSGDVAMERRTLELLAQADKGITPYAIVRIFDLGPGSRVNMSATAEEGEPAVLGATSDGTLRMRLKVRGTGSRAPACDRSGSLTLICALDIERRQDLSISLQNRSQYSGTAYVISN